MCDHSNNQIVRCSHEHQPQQNKSLFLGVMGTPYQSDLTTTVFRLINEALTQKIDVTVWTCGYATMLTQATLVRPANPLGNTIHETEKNLSTSELVKVLLKEHTDLLRWYVCRYCMEERGAIHQIPEVEIQIPFSFNTYLNIADKSLVLGVKS